MAKHADTYRSIENLFDGVMYQALEIEPGRVSITTHARRRTVLGLPRPAHGGPLSTGRDIPEPEPLLVSVDPAEGGAVAIFAGAGRNAQGGMLDTVAKLLGTAPHGYRAEGYRA